MKSVASAPGKVILLGEHFVVYGLKALLCCIDRRVRVTTERTDGKKITIVSALGGGEIDLADGRIGPGLMPFAYIAKKAISEFGHKGGLRVVIESDIPPGVGLGSSSACCVAAAASITGAFTKLSRDEILQLAIEAERTIFKDVSGADTAVCTHGGVIEYGKETGFDRIEAGPALDLVISNSGQAHSTGEMVSKVGKFKEENPGHFSRLCGRESGLVLRAREALAGNDLELLGRCMSENQKLLDAIGVSNKRLNSMIATANRTCHGSKITGAGGGGCIISLADGARIGETIGNLREDGLDCFSTKIDYKGLDTF